MNLAELHLTKHAVARYQERVKPHLSRATCERELQELVKLAGDATTTKPEWLYAEDLAGVLEISDGIVLGLQRDDPDGTWHAITCLTRAGLSESSREHVSRRRKARKGAQKMRGSKWRQRHAGRRDKRLGRRPASEQEE